MPHTWKKVWESIKNPVECTWWGGGGGKSGVCSVGGKCAWGGGVVMPPLVGIGP